MAKFKIETAQRVLVEVDGDYKIHGGGVLTVARTDGEPIIYSPSGWLSLEVVEGDTTVYDGYGMSIL